VRLRLHSDHGDSINDEKARFARTPPSDNASNH
jgi:hypothetical protein